MANPVWVLSVNLETKTAAFTSGMSEAARSARNSFKEVGDSAKAGTDEVKKGLFDVRHGLGLVDNVMRGQHAQAMADMVREFQNSSVVMTALPIAATVAGFALLAGIVYEVYQHLEKMKAAESAVTNAMVQIDTTANNTFMKLSDQLLKAQEQTDNLRGHHLAALRKELVLIDHQSMQELAQQFEALEKPVDAVFKQLARSWYEMGIGSAGAKHALTDFQVQYESLLSQGDKTGATDLLKGTLESAQKVLLAMRTAREENSVSRGGHRTGAEFTLAYWKALDVLKKAGVGTSKKEFESQEALVALLQDQLHVTGQIHALQSQNATNAVLEAHKRAPLTFATVKPFTDPALDAKGAAARVLNIEQDSQRQRLRMADEAARENARHEVQMGEQRIALQKEMFARKNGFRRASVSATMQEQMREEEELYRIQQGALQQQILAADKSGEDRVNKLQALFHREEELARQHQNRIVEIQNRALADQNRSLHQAMREMLADESRGLVASVMRHQTWGQMVTSIGNQVVSSILQNAIQSIAAEDMTKPHDAAAAARKMFNEGLKLPFPANIVAAPAMAAGAFATVMAYSSGTDMVPGVGRSDVVPAMLTPGEGVVPGGVMDGLRKVALSGGMTGQHHHHHYHDHRQFHVQALDRSGVRDVLEKHSKDFEDHFHHVMRKRHA